MNKRCDICSAMLDQLNICLKHGRREHPVEPTPTSQVTKRESLEEIISRLRKRSFDGPEGDYKDGYKAGFIAALTAVETLSTPTCTKCGAMAAMNCSIPGCPNR